MTTLVAYATSEGQTRRIARRVADRIADSGQTVELIGLSDADGIDLQRFSRVILAASVHGGQYQRALTDFASKNADQLHGKPTLFLSVSLSASGHDADDWLGLDRISQDFEHATGWRPGLTKQIAGAYRPSQYDVFRRFIMRRIIATRDPEADLGADKEYTDWPALEELVDNWLASTQTGSTRQSVA